MRRQLLILALALGTAAALARVPRVIAQTVPRQAIEAAAVSGVVMDGATNQPAAAAFVELARTDAGKTLTRRVTADSKGRFVFTDVEPGAGYSLTAGAIGYLSSVFGWEPGASDAQRPFTFPLAGGEWKRDLRVRIWRRGTIWGRVTDELGQPVVGVAVRAFAVEFAAGVARVVPSGVVASTDDRGLYRLNDLEPGEYKVGALSVQSTVPTGVPEVSQQRAIGAFEFGIRNGANAPSVSAPLVDAAGSHRLAITNFATPPAPVDGRPRAYPAVFYPAARSLADAEPVIVNWGDERGNVDIRLQPVPAFVVSGRLQGTFNAPILLRLLPAGFEYLGVGSEAATTLTESEGGFTFLNVPAGNYTLIGQGSILEMMKNPGSNDHLPDPPGYASGQNGGASWSGAPTVSFHNRRGVSTPAFVRLPISVAEDTTALVVSTSPTSSVRGRLVYIDGAAPPLSSQHLSISLEPLDGDPSLGNPSGEVDASASFTIENILPGRYRVSASGRVVSSVLARGRESADTGIEITAGQTIDDMTVTVTGKPARIDAAVTGLAPDSHAAVIVFPPSRDQWTNYGWNPPRIASATTDVSGAATFARLPAGDYFVIAVEASKTYAWLDPKFLAAAAGAASRVSVGWGESATVTLRVQRVIVR